MHSTLSILAIFFAVHAAFSASSVTLSASAAAMPSSYLGQQYDTRYELSATPKRNQNNRFGELGLILDSCEGQKLANIVGQLFPRLAVYSREIYFRALLYQFFKHPKLTPNT